MSYDVPRMAGDHEVDVSTSTGAGHPLWEIFVRAAWFESEKPYRHPTFYEIPDEVGHM